MFLFHRLSLSQELKKAPTPPAQQAPPPVIPAPPQPQVNSHQCNNPLPAVDFETLVSHLSTCICVVTIDWRHLIPLPSRRSEEEKQMGLCNSSDPGPAHHHHHYRNAARSCLCDDHCCRHQDHCHFGGGHHPEEGQAVKRPEPQRCVTKLEESCSHHRYVCERIQRGVKRTDGQLKNSPRRPLQTRLEAALPSFLWDLRWWLLPMCKTSNLTPVKRGCF